jgi:hypothetical protein
MPPSAAMRANTGARFLLNDSGMSSSDSSHSPASGLKDHGSLQEGHESAGPPEAIGLAVATSSTRTGRRAIVSRWAWLPAAMAILTAAIVTPERCRADDATPSIMGYAFEGFGTGLATGLAAGYLSTGSEFHSNEWRKLGWGMAIGALSGVGIGLTLGIVDASTSNGHAGIGYYIMRDSNYGFSVGALTGGIIGAIVWLSSDDGNSKDLLLGLAWGTVIGAGAGIILGVIEGALRGNRGSAASTARNRNFNFGLGFTPTSSGAPLPYPNISARF